MLHWMFLGGHDGFTIDTNYQQARRRPAAVDERVSAIVTPAQSLFMCRTAHCRAGASLHARAG